MANGLTQLSIAECRNLALRSQGFGGPRILDRPATTDDIQQVFDRIKLVQIDSVNVVARAQFMPFFSRIGPYQMDLLHEYTSDQRRTFEYWAHELCFVPVEHYPIIRHRSSLWEAEQRWDQFLKEHPDFEHDIITEVTQHGPLSVSDLEMTGPRIGHWAASPGKLALYHLHRAGRLTISDRRTSAPSYDLIERVVPSDHLNKPAMVQEDAYRCMAEMAIDAMGIATLADIADYYRVRRRDMAKTVELMTQHGGLVQLRVANSKKTFYAHPNWESLTTRVSTRCLLSPFDSLVWSRDRIEWLFDFHYRIEIYVPASKRQYGYYVLPFLLDDRPVARVDLKCDRRAKVLRVPGAFLETGADSDHTAQELAAELCLMADWLGMERVVVGRRGDFVTPLRHAVKEAARNR